MVLSLCFIAVVFEERRYQNAFRGGKASIYVVNHGWHTGFVVPSRYVQQQLPELKNRFADTSYLEIGWGDKGFYQAETITASITLNALLWPSDSVMHVVAVPANTSAGVARYFSNSQVMAVSVSDSELKRLVLFIAESFKRSDANATVVPLQKGLYGDSQFYAGVNTYHLMNTCNKWTAQGLQSMGMDISPRFKLTAGSIMDYLGKL